MAMGLLHGQGETPPASDPEVLRIFLRFHSRLMEGIQQQRSTDAGNADHVERQWRAILKTSPQDTQQLLGAYAQLRSALDVLDKESKRHIDQASRTRSPIREDVLEAIEAKRQNSIRGTVARLQSNMTTAGWQGVQSFMARPGNLWVNGRLRAGIE